MNNPKISVIVPVYNTEKYLQHCIDSILAQTFTDFELLLIDDGSKDGSGVICDKYAAKDKRVKVFHKENGGVSSARNMGLDNAKGEWLIFLDSDDFWSDIDILDVLINSANKIDDVDIVRGEFKIYNQNSGMLKTPNISKKKLNYQNQNISNQIFLKYIVGRDFYSVLLLCRAKIVKNIRFNTERIYLEDMEWIISILIHPIKCVYVARPFYVYRHHEDAVTSKTDIRLLRDAFSMCLYLKKQLFLINNEVLKNDLKNRMIHIYIDTLSVVAQEHYYYSRNFIVNSFSVKKIQHDIASLQMIKWLYVIKPMHIIYFFHLKNIIKQIIKQLR